jgi:hypothetical protein
LEHFRGPHAMISEHIPDDLLDQYSRGSLEGPKLDELEEHLLMCELCRDRLTEFDHRWGLNG